MNGPTVNTTIDLCSINRRFRAGRNSVFDGWIRKQGYIGEEVYEVIVKFLTTGARYYRVSLNYKVNSAMTGAWSLGRSHERGDLSMRQAVHLSARAGEVQI